MEELLDPSVDRIHFDEAWYAYARFNPIYRDRHAMHGDPKDHKGPTVFATHSTHKLLAALSQASLLHIRDGRSPIPHARFNESFMMHASTSPLYPIIVSNDITAAMMDGPGGLALTSESIEEAVAFRQTMGRVHREFAREEGLVLQHLERGHGEGGQERQEGRASTTRRPSSWPPSPTAWVLHPGETWHGFGDLEDGYCMLDPIKVSIVTPGVADKGGLDKQGIPATLVTAYLHHRGVEVEKTTDFTILFLFSIGITKGKWGTLLNALLDFKRDYDRNAPLAEVLPRPGRRASRRLRRHRASATWPTRCSRSSRRPGRRTGWPRRSRRCPTPVMTPNDAYQQLSGTRSSTCRSTKLANRVLATSVVPYPPGHPDADARRVHRRGRRSVPRLPAGALRRGTRGSPASGTTRTASRTGTARTTCSA